MGGCTTTGVVAPRGDYKGRDAPDPEPKGILASVNNFRREDVQKFFDEVTHVELPAKLVREARAEELEYFNTLPVWEVVKTQECWDVTGHPPISTKWVDGNKGDQRDYDIRCRLVAREMGGAKSDEFYAPTPPLEAKRLQFSEAATHRGFGKHEKGIYSLTSGNIFQC